METRDTLSSCSNSEEQQMQQIQDKAKKSCIVSFRQLHSHLKLLSNNDLKGTRTECGFKHAFATLFGQDVETFTGTMFLNMDQLEKQLDNEEFQEIGSMVLLKPIYDEEPMAEVQLFADNNVFATGQQHTEQPEFNNEREKCVFNANYDSCVTKFLKEVNSRAKVPSNKTTNRNKPVEQTSFAKKPERHIPKGHRFSIKKTYVVHKKTMTHRQLVLGGFLLERYSPLAQPKLTVNPQMVQMRISLTHMNANKFLMSVQRFKEFKSDKQVMTSDYNSLELGIHDHNNEPSNSKLVPKVVPPADKTATSRQELELLFHHHITMLRLYSGGGIPFQLKSDSLPRAHAQTIKTYYKHQDLRIKKAQDLKTKTFANSDIKDNSSETKLRGRLLEGFQEDTKYEHVGQDTRSQGGKDDQDKQRNDLKISKLKTKSKDNDNGSRSKITQHEGTSLQHNKDQRFKNSMTNNLKKFKEARFKIAPHEFEDHTFGEIVSLK
uniref:Integrase, catalytic region, zinc finger, CCHC-type, peptidase aspartic, catalytic n=1 Tax=Tanacetum cinerariifolium TaxID=118510 RepID=A0A6L2NE95_TANCI|nr:hypothetical protein [Tanacetum cinerariifolium]